MKKRLLLVAVAILLALPQLFAQKNVDWGVGLRFGSPTGLDVKHYMGRNAWQLTVGTGVYGLYDPPDGYRNGYIGFSAMFNYLWCKDWVGARGLQYYYGIGGLLSSREYYRHDWRKNYLDDPYVTRVAFGPTAALGIEYFIPAAPISLFAEANPYVEIYPYPLYIGLGASIGARFTF